MARARSTCRDRNKNEPEVGLDRLHTFLVKYMRVVCCRHGIAVDREKPLHSLMGEYVKVLKVQAAIEALMCGRILKSSISLLEGFNEVRNERSLAHENRVVAYERSLLIFNQVTSVIRFIEAVERPRGGLAIAQPIESDDFAF